MIRSLQKKTILSAKSESHFILLCLSTKSRSILHK